MKNKIIFSTMLAFAVIVGQAQESKTKDSKHIIKIVTVDENGNREVVVMKYDDLNIDELPEAHQIHITEGDIEVITNEDGNEVFVTRTTNIPEGPFLGIHLAEVDNGILITEVVKGSGAEIAGLQKGDILTSFNKSTIKSQEDLKAAMTNLKVGDKVKLEYLRNGKLNKTSATLGEFPEKEFERKMIWLKDGNEMIFSDEEVMTCDMTELKSEPFLGITPVENVVDISGVMIFKVIEGTSAERLGLQTGDVIYEINTNTIESFENLVVVFKEMSPNDAIEIKYKRDGVKKVASDNLGSKADSKNSMKYMIKDFQYDSDEVIEVDIIVYSISEKELEMLSKSCGNDLKSIDKMDDVDIDIYPNPSAGNFNLIFSSPEKNPVTIKIYNSNGTEIYTKTINNFDGECNSEIELENNSAGGYFMIITQNDKVLTEKIIIN